MSFSSDRHPVARKRHGCAWCHEWIDVGERHYHYTGKWEGEFQDWRMHEECADSHQSETYEGEICEGPHPRGLTCAEKEEAQLKLAKEVQEAISDELEEKGVPKELIAKVAADDIALMIVRDIFEEAIYAEEQRVAELRTKAIEAGKAKSAKSSTA